MSMHRFANAGPIMASLAAMREEAKLLIRDEDREPVRYIPHENVGGEDAAPGQWFAVHEHSNDDLLCMIENIANQVSEIAAEMVEIRKRLDAIEAIKPAVVDADALSYIQGRDAYRKARQSATAEYYRACYSDSYQQPITAEQA